MADKSDVKQIAEFAIDQARAALLAGDDFPRTFFASDAGGDVTAICIPAEGEAWESRAMRWLKAAFHCLAITQYAMVSEVWISSDPKYSRANGLLPEHDPKKREALSLIATRRVRGESGAFHEIRACGHCYITRDPFAVAPLEWTPDTAQLSGRMFNLLPPADLAHHPVPPNIRDGVLKGLGFLQARKLKME